MNPENGQNANWEMQGNSFSNKTMKRLASIMQRIASFVSLNSKWLNKSLNSKYTQFDSKGNNFRWIDRLVNRLQSPTMFHMPDFQRTGYESARLVKYRWYDPRHWPTSFLQNDSEDMEPEESEFEQHINSRVNEPQAAKKILSKHGIAARIAAKYLKAGSTISEPSTIEEPVLSTPRLIDTRKRADVVINLPEKLNKPFPENRPMPVELIYPFTPLRPADNDALLHILNEAPQHDVSSDTNKEEFAVTEPAEIKHRSSVAGKIQKAINQFFSNMNRTDILPGPNRISAFEKPVNAIKPFLRRYLSNKLDASDSVIPMEFEQQAHESYSRIDNPVVPQVTGLSGDSPDALLPGMTSLPEYRTYETMSSIPPDTVNEISMSLPFVDSHPIISQAFSFNSPVSVSAPYAPATFTAVAGNVGQGNGISQGAGSGSAYLAMAPLTRPMPAELALRPMPEELRDTEATESAEETTTEQREPPYDPELVAAEVYAIIKRRLLIEKERARGSL